jgi:hypothetical protein
MARWRFHASLSWCVCLGVAGTYPYELQVFLGTGATTVQYTAAAGANCAIAAFELG